MRITGLIDLIMSGIIMYYTSSSFSIVHVTGFLWHSFFTCTSPKEASESPGLTAVKRRLQMRERERFSHDVHPLVGRKTPLPRGGGLSDAEKVADLPPREVLLPVGADLGGRGLLLHSRKVLLKCLGIGLGLVRLDVLQPVEGEGVRQARKGLLSKRRGARRGVRGVKGVAGAAQEMFGRGQSRGQGRGRRGGKGEGGEARVGPHLAVAAQMLTFSGRSPLNMDPDSQASMYMTISLYIWRRCMCWSASMSSLAVTYRMGPYCQAGGNPIMRVPPWSKKATKTSSEAVELRTEEKRKSQ